MQQNGVWDFHLINHPLDCPICDQAGECGLQDQYMEFGKYDPEMAERKQKKHKVVDLGPTVVLDSERCILCSRCVRFTDEVSKTSELGIFNRGDHSEIGTHEGKPLDNNYSLNTVDICPVGALTSKDFRFRQRVWYLKDSKTICNGCSTGCSVKVYYNKEGFFRVKPVYNEAVNGHWMCDEGRDIYKFANRNARWTRARKKTAGRVDELMPGAAAKDASTVLKDGGHQTAAVLTAQYTVEEFTKSLADLKGIGVSQFYFWNNNAQTMAAFDDLLLRGDRNPNTNGLLQVAKKLGIELIPLFDVQKETPGSGHQTSGTGAGLRALQSSLTSKQIQTVLVAGPENQIWFPEYSAVIGVVSLAQNLIWLQSTRHEELEKLDLPGTVWLVPMKSFTEKEGTFVNFKGLEQKFKKVTTVVSESLTLIEAIELASGQMVVVRPDLNVFVEAVRPMDQVMVETRKKNEFTFKRGRL